MEWSGRLEEKKKRRICRCPSFKKPIRMDLMVIFWLYLTNRHWESNSDILISRTERI